MYECRQGMELQSKYSEQTLWPQCLRLHTARNGAALKLDYF